MSDLSNPHDAFFKEMLSRVEVARGFLERYLPPEVSRALDLASLEIVKDSFVDDALREHFSDLLYTVALRDGGKAHLYVLFEHKSAPEPRIAYHLLRYMVRVWELDLRQVKALLPIVPVVMYHGRDRWRVGMRFHDLLQPAVAVAPFVPDYRYWLCDLSEYADEELRGEVLLRATLLLLKHIARDDLGERLPGIFSLLSELSDRRTGLEYLETMLRYVSCAADRVTESDLDDAVRAAIGSAGGVTVPTLAQQWLEQGRQEGEQRGMHDGLCQGLKVGLELKFGAEGLHLVEDLAQIEDVEILLAIGEALRTVETVEELRALYPESLQ